MPQFLRSPWPYLGFVALLMLACGIGGALALQRGGSEVDVALYEARARWDRRDFSAYSMRLRDRGCGLEVEVRAERVVKTRYDTQIPCEQPGVAVRDLFALVERDGSVRRACVSRGCACDDVLTVRAEYHPSLGYPQSLEISLTPSPNWRHADFWSAVWQTRSLDTCDSLMAGSRVLRVLELTPIQQ